MPDELIKRIDESFDIVMKMFGHATVYCFGWAAKSSSYPPN
jgi:hypothetical protein